MGSKPYLFQFVKQRKRDLPKVSYIEHVLPSSSSLNQKEILIYLDGGKIWKKQAKQFLRSSPSNSYGLPWTWHLVFACISIHWNSALSQSFEFPIFLWVTWRKSQHPLHYQVLVHAMFLLLCLSVQGKYPPRESAITNILSQYPCLSMFIWSTNYISVSVSCHWWGIHQGPPSTSLFLSTSTHYPGTRPRN